MNFEINGGYQPFTYVALLQAGLFFLQRLNYLRMRSTMRGASATANAVIDFYCALAAFVATILSWGTWALAIYVAYQFGFPAGILLFAVGLIGGTVLPVIMPPGVAFDLLGHLVSLFTVPYLVFLTLQSVNLLPGH